MKNKIALLICITASLSHLAAASATTQIFDDGSTLTTENGTIIASTSAPNGALISDAPGFTLAGLTSVSTKQVFDDGSSMTLITNTATGDFTVTSTNAPTGALIGDSPEFRLRQK